MVVNEIPKIISSNQVRELRLYSNSRSHVMNPEQMFEMNEREDRKSMKDITLDIQSDGYLGFN
ncbi:hypothetical protein OAJ98_02260 [Deltaproteobacteria bacterium]|nr:hypothetical protein [Deltaproteobacteria bacterium]